MNINASIVDQQLEGIVQNHSSLLPKSNDPIKLKSTAFVLLCAATLFDADITEAADWLTEGGGDAGVDAMHVSDVDDGEFTVTLFQGKYKHNNLDGEANFSENGIKSAITTIATLFDPNKQVEMNDRLKPKVEEVRSLIRDGYIPLVRMVLCNNGITWKQEAQHYIDQAGFSSDQVQWRHFNHDDIVNVLKRKKSVDDAITLRGSALIEDFNFRRVLIGKVSVHEVAELFNRNGDLLLERNIRRYLGLNRNRVNSSIHETLLDESKRGNFYFFNNGITMICKKFRHNALQGKDFQLKLEGIQVINGGQTCKTIQQTLNQPDLLRNFDDTYVLLRLYELAEDDSEFVQDITFATNSQNPVDLRDLRSNDPVQVQLELGLKGLGYTYKRKRDEVAVASDQLTSSVVAEATLAIWRRKPHQAKFKRSELFGKLYDPIFATLNPEQALLATIIFRLVENERKRPQIENPPAFLPYASHYIAMLIGDELLRSKSLLLEQITHKNIDELRNNLELNNIALQQSARHKIERALTELYGDRKISLQQLSATFRRGDLEEVLAGIETQQLPI
ncbi:MAG TPA: AIPR family protein [Cellvibrionaceae bacterium]|nr:AIPR family protein [Cellvibrionaceae bacterium]HNG61581.1 AIPR family protein [Cellvibrionaceae bacterium]